MHPFRLADPDLVALGAGRPAPETLGLLRRAQLSRHLLLLREIRLKTDQDPIWYGVLHAMPVEESRTRIADPMTGLWAAQALSALRAAAPPAPGSVPGPAPTTPAPGPSPATPAAGSVAGLSPATPGPAIALGELPEPAGHVLSVTHAGRTLTVRLDDRGPLRHLLGLAPTGPLDPAGVAHWRTCLDEAWRILITRHPGAADIVEGVLRVIVPARPDPRAEGVSATSAIAFGAVAMSAPVTGTGLAVALLHETQHSVLNAVHGLFELVGPGSELGYSPWREDPRPAFGTLHGVYAFLAVTRFWRTERSARTPHPLSAPAHPLSAPAHLPGAQAETTRRDERATRTEGAQRTRGGKNTGGGSEAEFEFARWRAAVHETAGQLLAGGELTAAGVRLVGALRDEVEPWLDEPVDPEVERLADLARADHYARWRLRNLTVSPEDARALAEAWRAGRAAPAVESTVSGGERVIESSPRLQLIRARLRGDEIHATEAPSDAGDVACVLGDADAALTSYQIGVVNDQDAAWSGLALVSPHPALRRRPELVRAAALAAPEADLAEIAAWLSSADER
ncbi:aKG-HExxH-type peptide beta-hydroxylase [Actinoplanes sp. HUAS TT8]|uniref:aKG-HExxH-type peptide beta-hydroxylase n=1 Tax=Actinoplanes sp. HUAS TT8 TaxID=3447453 RepID=UPI003F522CEB